MGKLTVAELLQRKETIKGQGQDAVTLQVESLAGEIVITQFPNEILGEAMSKDSGSDEYAVLYGVSEPNLRDKELQAAFACTEPTDIVNMLFKLGEIKAIAAELMKLSGYGGRSVKRVDETL
ncbi:hypothetical protein [Paenibacillus sp. FSL H8-0537]|uniref:phage tail assembly chaperone n=1 Tax=Paenibacillus sp. FSL H8-0537 TaxID=2921399 RepID=UPI0031019354